jgi:hypothetical protein
MSSSPSASSFLMPTLQSYGIADLSCSKEPIMMKKRTRKKRRVRTKTVAASTSRESQVKTKKMNEDEVGEKKMVENSIVGASE